MTNKKSIVKKMSDLRSDFNTILSQDPVDQQSLRIAHMRQPNVVSQTMPQYNASQAPQYSAANVSPAVQQVGQRRGISVIQLIIIVGILVCICILFQRQNARNTKVFSPSHSETFEDETEDDPLFQPFD